MKPADETIPVPEHDTFFTFFFFNKPLYYKHIQHLPFDFSFFQAKSHFLDQCELNILFQVEKAKKTDRYMGPDMPIVQAIGWYM